MTTITSIFTDIVMTLLKSPVTDTQTIADFLLLAEKYSGIETVMNDSHVRDNDFLSKANCEAILEARCYGIPVALLSHTYDKFVVTPDLFTDKYDYIFHRGSWGECEYSGTARNFTNYCMRLKDLGKLLSSLGLSVYKVSINCSEKGYLSIYSTKDMDDEDYSPNEEFVLFVYRY